VQFVISIPKSICENYDGPSSAIFEISEDGGKFSFSIIKGDSEYQFQVSDKLFEYVNSHHEAGLRDQLYVNLCRRLAHKVFKEDVRDVNKIIDEIEFENFIDNLYECVVKFARFEGSNYVK
jgi:hypothetical protein